MSKPEAQQYVLIGTGEGASCEIVTDLREGLHRFMCCCDSTLDECENSDTLEMLKEMYLDDNWSFDEAGRRFQYSFSGYCYGITVTAMYTPSLSRLNEQS